ncbi:MAG: hypothetical protein BACB_04001 [Bacteroides thetaiotaomicron]|jgi:hypothetical protein
MFNKSAVIYSYKSINVYVSLNSDQTIKYNFVLGYVDYLTK